MTFEFPTKDDWKRIESSFPIRQCNLEESKFKITGESLEDIKRRSDLSEWFLHIQNRFFEVLESYIMLTFYYEKGIPDDEWWISPGKRGESVQYFPHFEERHHLTKADFDYYADVFYYKIFTLWHTIGHLLNVYYDLKITRPNLYKAINTLNQKRPSLYDDLKLITDDPAFKKASELRNNIAHNHRPNSISESVTTTAVNQVTLGVGNYVTSKEIYSNVVASMKLLGKTLNAVNNSA